MSHRATFERFFAAIQRRDRETVAALIHPDFQIVEAPSLPYAGTWRGFDGWRGLNRAVAGAWADMNVVVDEILGESADALVVRMTLSGRAGPSGTPFTTSILEIWRFEGGQVRGITPYYWDTHHLASLHAGAPEAGA